MIAALDSATPPTAGQVAAARAAGVGGWWGYIGTRPRLGLLNLWTEADFEVARACGSTPIAFASGWDDPVILGQLARAWRVRLCLDDEEAIRPDGPWVQPWLDASGAGLYGNCWLHTGRRAAFHILSWYPGGVPRATWYDPLCARPAGPVGWQSVGTHQEFGVDVDSGWYDDWFGGDPQEVTMRLFHDPMSGAIWFVSGSLVFHVESAADAQALQAAGVPQTDVSAQFLQDLETAAARGQLVAHVHPGGTTGPAVAS